MKYIYSLLIFWFLAENATAQPASKLAKAEKLIQEGSFKDAILILNEAIKVNTSNGQALRLLGNIYLQERNFRLATLFLQQAIEKSEKPESNMFFDLAEALHYRHQFEEAIENYVLSNPNMKSKALIARKIKECEAGLELLKKPLEVKISNLGDKVNSPFSDYHPLITADFMQLFFTRESEAGSEIFQSINKGNWEKSIPLASPVNAGKDEKCAGISADGQMIAIVNSNNKGDLYFSEFGEGNWSKPKAFQFNSPKTESSVCFSSDRKKMFFVSDRNGSKDIFSCTKSGQGWSKPVKLGNHVNTNQDEESPWLDADGKYLYFSSKGHNGIGGFDIFKVELNDVNSEPENIGFPINSASDDLYYMVLPDEKTAFYSSFRDGGFGLQDIYSIRMSIGKTPQAQLFKGTVSEVSGLPLDAFVIITELASNQVVAKLKSHPETGTFVTMLQASKKYTLLVEKEGYLFYSDFVDLSELESADLSRNIRLQKFLPGVTLLLNNIFFDFGKSSLKKESSQELQRILMIMRQNPSLKAEISSHFDDSGIPEISQKLSEYRSQAIVDYLVVTGIKSTRLQAKGYGSSKPISDNKTEIGRAVNRRTEFKILSIQ